MKEKTDIESIMGKRKEVFVPRRIDSLIRERTSMTRKEVIRDLEAGKIFVHGEAVLDPRQLVFDDSAVLVGSEKLPCAPTTQGFLFNKPSGLISAYKSEIDKPNIGSFMDQMGENLIHIGRLDKLTTGLLLITNDGDLCHALTEPTCKVEKKYLLQLNGNLGQIGDKIEKLSTPIVNRKTKKEVVYRADEIRVLNTSDTQTWVEVTLTEGKNRQIRRMCAILHLELIHLHRTHVGGLELGDLPSGAFRELNAPEMAQIYGPFGGIGGFEKKRAERLIALFDSGAFLPEQVGNVKEWMESYLGIEACQSS